MSNEEAAASIDVSQQRDADDELCKSLVKRLRLEKV